MVFVDTSAIYALADRKDPNHQAAHRRLERLLAEGEELLTHSYVVVESISLVQHRLGVAPAVKLAKSAEQFTVEWIGEDTHTEAIRRLAETGRRKLSFIDLTSFIVMRQHGVTTAFAFDDDFAKEGFRLYSPD